MSKKIEVQHDGQNTSALISASAGDVAATPGPVAGTASLETSGLKGIAFAEDTGWWRPIGLWRNTELHSLNPLDAKPKMVRINTEVDAKSQALRHQIEHAEVRQALVEKGEALQAAWRAIRLGASPYAAFRLGFEAKPTKEQLEEALQAALGKKDAQTYRAVSLLAGVAAACGIRLSPEPEEQMLRGTSTYSSIAFVETRWVERYVLAIEDSERVAVLAPLGWLARFARCSFDPLTAQAMLDKYLTFTGKLIDWNALRCAAKGNPAAVLGAIEGAPKKHAEYLVAALAFSDDNDALALFAKHIGKPYARMGARAAIRTNAKLRDLLTELAKAKSSKTQKAAASLMALWTHRDAGVAAEDARLHGLVDACSAELRRTLIDAFENGAITHAETLLELAAKHGAVVWAVLRHVVRETYRCEGVRRLEAVSHPTQLDQFLRALPAARSAAAFIYATRLGELLHARGSAADYVADEVRFRNLGFATKVSEKEMREPEYVPVLLETLRETSKKAFEIASSRLNEHRSEALAGLGPYLVHPDYMLSAARLAEQLAARSLVAPLEEAIATKPGKKALAQLEASLVACKAAVAAAGEAEAPSEGVPADGPSKRAALSAGLLVFAKGRTKLPEWRSPLNWANGDPLSAEEREGCLRMFLRIQDVSQAEGLRAYAEALKDTAAIAAEALRLQPLAAKAKEVWSLYLTSAFGGESQMEAIREAASQGHHALAKHAIAALGRRGQGRDVRALFRAQAAGGKKTELAEQALGGLLGKPWTRASGRERYELFESAFAGETDETLLAELRSFFEVSMILGRPFGAEYIAGLCSEAFIGRALLGAVLQQGNALFFVAPHGVVGVEGAEFGDADVILVHPVKLSDDQRGAATNTLKDAGLSAPFPQLERECIGAEYDALQTRAKASKSLRGYESRGYRSGEYNPDANAVCSIVRRLGPGAHVELDVDGSIDDHAGVLGFHLDSPFDARDPGLLSEVALDLEAIAG